VKRNDWSLEVAIAKTKRVTRNQDHMMMRRRRINKNKKNPMLRDCLVRLYGH
jgi:hypothetical protein